ncbi:Nuclear MIS12/MIND complex subunit PMF1/Nnf1 [Arabidopsis thaliana x Arabidopsis arenosa]|uniref:Nuclear MIS12/MIND complex subunit PMF1/Nnf1 n=1 Tax=Arabidopsis thaliana x Arabidopsis arenosa TaxID=1240361 RepID=A0A8T1Y559_9BRAS|nr:Nuclear MIS12/MIND complex subunit PMF1/Nnf1 [Arabidopsis thaliana x Arabidopsis arenosa]
MEQPGHETDIPGSRRTNLKKSFKSSLRSLLTACSKQEFFDIFSKFSGAEQELLFQFYTQVVVNLHQTIEDEFDEQCHEAQVGSILDTVEQLVEEQSLDPLFSDKTDVMAITNDLTTAKKNEIQKLKGLLQRAEEQNRQKEARISLLKKQTQDFSSTTDRVEKLKAGFSGYFEGKDKLPPI